MIYNQTIIMPFKDSPEGQTHSYGDGCKDEHGQKPIGYECHKERILSDPENKKVYDDMKKELDNNNMKWIEIDFRHYLSIGTKAPWMNRIQIRVPLWVAKIFRDKQ